MNTTDLYEEIKALNALCKAGKLFEVQNWINKGKPINPQQPLKGNRRKTPLEVAIDCGFHSLVQILLEAGAVIADNRYNALEQAVFEKRLDIIMLLLDHGADIHSVKMIDVFDTWDPKIMEYFVEHGADVETDYPLAEAFCMKIRTALGVFKRHRHRCPSFQEQANIALRHHCREGNLKWVSLMLWAGADPYATGPELGETELDPEDERMSALEYAALYDHYEIFKLKQIKLDPQHSRAGELLDNSCFSEKSTLLKMLLEKGFKPSEQKDGGTSLIQKCLMTMCGFWDRSHGHGPTRNLDTHRSREKIKMIHLLAKNGAQWKPHDNGAIKDARISLLKMIPDYTVEFIWIMSEYKSSDRDCIEELIRTPSIKAVLAEHKSKINELLNKF